MIQRHAKILKGICKICSKEFEYSSKHPKKYCSKKCLAKAKHKSIKENTKKELKCTYCGKTYKCYRKINTDNHFCCVEHALLYTSQKKRKENIKECIICKNEFYSSHKQVKCCSRKCANILAQQTKNTFTEEKRNEISKKCINTMHKNNSFVVSKPEQQIKQLLENKFKIIKYQYKSELYPFNCDFYIPELNLYIEYQGTWMHGKKPFNKNDTCDLQKLNKWKNKNTKYYEHAIKVWTIKDPLKRKTAERNKLNWLEFFDMKQFLAWYDNLSV